MELIPAIDLIGGRVVRLLQGDFDRVTEYPVDPVRLAVSMVGAGATFLHLVDLEGALAGDWRNLATVAAVAAAVAPVPVQVGGGARDMARIEAGLAAGAARIIVGTAATESVETVGAWAGELGPRLVVSLDSRAGRVLGRGWTSAGGGGLGGLAAALREVGVSRFIHTDVRRDGTLAGSDLTGLRCLLPLGLPVLVAGGVSSYADLAALREAGAEGAIVGRAILERRIEVTRGVAVAAGLVPA